MIKIRKNVLIFTLALPVLLLSIFNIHLPKAYADTLIGSGHHDCSYSYSQTAGANVFYLKSNPNTLLAQAPLPSEGFFDIVSCTIPNTMPIQLDYRYIGRLYRNDNILDCSCSFDFKFNRSTGMISNVRNFTFTNEANSSLYISSQDDNDLIIYSTQSIWSGNVRTEGYLFYKNNLPLISITTPSSNQSFSEVAGNNSIAASGTVNDADVGDVEKIYYRIDGNAGDPGTQIAGTITADATNQAWSGTIDVSAVTEGTHTLYTWAEDDKGGKSAEVSKSFNMDKTAPSVSAPTVTVDSSTQITIQGNATDPVTNGVAGGLHTSPYQYNRNNIDVGTWQAGNLVDTGLIANTQYTYKIKARDTVGHSSGYSATVAKYTLALTPTAISGTGSTNTSLKFSVTNAPGQGTAPSTRIEVKLKGAGLGGAVVSASDFNTAVTDRTITGLAQSTHYEVWLITRNGDGIANAPVKLMDDIVTNTSPSLSITSPTAGEVFSEVGTFNSIAASGTVNDADVGDVEKIYYRIDGNAGDPGTQIAGTITADATNQAWSGTIDVSAVTEGTHTLYTWAEDDKGGKSAEVSKGFNMDKTAPSVSAPTVTVDSSTQITIQGNATDPVTNGVAGGLHTSPYQYNRNNIDVGTWQAGNLVDTGLVSNTQYTYKIKARDTVGHSSGYSATVAKYTLAINPTAISGTGSTNTSLKFSVTNAPGQGTAPSTRIEVKLKGAGLGGAVVSASDFDTAVTDRTITGLAQSTHYEVWLITKNGDGIANAPVKLMDDIVTNTSPSLSITSPTTGEVFSEIAGHSTVSVTGTVTDPDNDNVTVKATFSGVTKSIVVNSCAGGKPFTLSFDVVTDLIAEGSYDISIVGDDGR